MVPAEAFVHVHLDVDLLVRSHLGDQDVRVDGADGVLAREPALLPAEGLKDDVPRVDVRVVIQNRRIPRILGRVLVMRALGCELEAHSVCVEGRRVGVLFRARLAPEPHELAQTLLAAGEGDEAQSMRQNLVLDDRRVVIDKDGLDGEGGDLGDHDTTEGVGDGGVDADEGELGLELVILVELNLEPATKLFLVPGMFFVGIILGIVVGDGVCDCFFVDANCLVEMSVAYYRLSLLL